MKYLRFVPIIIVIFGLGFKHAALWCIYVLTGCNLTSFFHGIFGSVISPLYLFSLIASVPALILAFVRKAAFYSWLRFAAWWLPLSAILIATTPETSNSWMPLFFIGKDTVTIFMASLFTVISLILIVWKQFNLGKRLT